MSRIPILENDELRVASVLSYNVVEPVSAGEFDTFARLVASVCDTPIALVTILDATNNVFISRVGLDLRVIPREESFCIHAAARPTELMVVPDARLDPRFRDNPLVVAAPFIRFYAGVPLVSADGFVLGTLCVIDVVPRELSAAARTTLELAGRCVLALLEERRTSMRLERALEDGRAATARATLLESVAISAEEGVFILACAENPGGLPRVVFANASVGRLTGWSPEVVPQTIDETLWTAIADRDGRAGLAAVLAGRRPYVTEALVRRRDGRANLLQFSFSPVPGAKSGELRQWIVLASDVTDRNRADAVELRADTILARNGELCAEIERRRDLEERLQFAVAHDALTGLRNRSYFLERLGARLLAARQRPRDASFAVMFLDVDRFKTINDTLGHLFGDDLLVVLARRIAGCVRAQDVVSRLGGDEFTILVESATDRQSVSSLAGRIARAIAAPCRLGQSDVVVSASIGVVFDDGTYATTEEILRDADIAMLHAKASGRDRHEIFREEFRDRVVGEARLENALRGALDRGEFELRFEPIYDLAGAAPGLVGFEALSHWNHRYRQEIDSAAFVSAAEDVGLIGRLGDWAIGEACRELRRRQAASPAGHARPFVSVKIAIPEALREGFVASVGRALAAEGLFPADLAIELTERAMPGDVDRLAEVLVALRGLGVRTWIDAFAMGFATLDVLQTYPIDCLTIARVSGVGRDGKSDAIFESVAHLAHRLGMTVLARGVDRAEDIRALGAVGCDYAQGPGFREGAASQSR